MHTAILKQVGDAVVVEVPVDLLRQLHASPGQSVSLRADDAVTTLAVQTRPNASLREMLHACDFSLPMTEEEREWVESAPLGRERM